ncbi:MAG TPA: extracellular solute-binding protein [Burkholderiaceae bacterium]|nr:extracellular solute-binding protein [Burkholderiaceae bacterium]
MIARFAAALRRATAPVAFAVVATGAANAGTVTVITSFPKELTGAYKAAFEKAHPGIRLEILNKGTSAAIAFVREQPPGNRPDVFWASAPDAFEVLAREKLLERVANLANPDVPAKIGNYPINDPKGLYLGQALAGYGIMWNQRYLQANKLPPPAEWSDLVKPAYFNHVAMSSPSRSGTTHLTIETILQGEGWDKGWEQVLRIAGNCAQITERSFGVPDGVNSGQFGIGLVIDFFGLAGKYSGFPVDFVYPRTTAVVPANIGLISGGRNADEARRFIEFTLSQPGQQLLLDPKISRLPVLPIERIGAKVPPDFPKVAEIAKRARVQFDSQLSESRYYLVSALFDQTITFRHKELQAATRAIHDAEAKLAGKPNPQAAELLAQARSYAFSPLVSAQTAKDPNFLELFTKNKKDAAVNKQITGLEDSWNAKARANYAKARELAQQAAALAR